MFSMNKIFDSKICFSLKNFFWFIDNVHCFPPDYISLFPFSSIMMTFVKTGGHANFAYKVDLTF